KSEVFVLQVHLIDPERLAAIVQRTATRTIGVRQRITLRQEVTFFVQRTERFVADLVIEQDELAEIRASPVIDIDLPPALHFPVWTAAQGVNILRALRFHHEGAE